ncbi:amidase signature domain-containing protein [Tricladium varicosporioides]|nr:amidase signature domain-containing protein [Hymenoscyphus varicosporioides]
MATTEVKTPADFALAIEKKNAQQLGGRNVRSRNSRLTSSRGTNKLEQLTNCLTEIFFVQALEHAKKLDIIFAKNGKPTGALFGLPISLKDQFEINDTECNMGIASWIGQVSKENSVLVDILQDAGAISSNPFNRKLTPGGSSSGEGATVAMRGSVIGVGTDLGGSVRIPAAYNRLYGLRPTLHRLPYAGARNTLLGLESIASALGPLSRSLSGIKLFVQAILEAKPWFFDPKTPEIPWRQDMADLKHLKDSNGSDRKPMFGVMRWDEYVMPWPPIRRAINMVVDSLKKAGHEVIDFPPPFSTAKAEAIVTRVYSSDGGEDLRRTFATSGEPHHPMMSWQLNLEKYEVATAWLRAWNATAKRTSTGQPVDGIILPPSANVAHKHGEWPRRDFRPANTKDGEMQAMYSPEVYAGTPMTVQLVCRRFREEECIGLAGVVSSCLKS